MIKNYLIAICDIMDFTELVRKVELQKIIDLVFSNLNKSLRHSIFQKDYPEKVPSIRELKSQNVLGFAWYSDTILLYTIDDTDENCKQLIDTVAWLISENILYSYHRLRAGISYGEAYINKEEDAYVGKAIIDALKLEKAQEWCGGSLTREAEDRVLSCDKSGNLSSWVKYYNVPLKNNLTEKLLVIDWTLSLGPHDTFEGNWSQTQKNPPLNELIEHPDRVIKLRNTKIFHDDVCICCKNNSHDI